MTKAALRGACVLAMLAGTTAVQADIATGPVVAGPTAVDLSQFEPIAGYRELSGRVIAKPIDFELRHGFAVTPAQASNLEQAAAAALARYKVVLTIDAGGLYVLEVPAGASEITVAQDLLSTGAFEFVEPDWTLFITACPNDPLFNQQWHHAANRMQSCDAWDIEVGDPNVVVAVGDTGLDVNHVDLQLHRYEGWNATSGLWESQGGAIVDTGSHGTLVTGTVTANGNNGIGLSGVAQSLGHRTMRVSENGNSSSLANLVNAAITAAQAGDKVANISFSGVDSSSVRSAGTTVRNLDALLFWSAGNSSTNMGANNRDNDDVLVVGATDQNDNLASFSSFGNYVDFTAPGVGVATTAPNNSYQAVNGTSFASPAAAGVAGLLFSANPNLTADEVEAIMKATAEDLGSPGVDNTFGYGRLNSYLALLDANPSLQVELVSVAPGTLDPNGGDQITVSVNLASGLTLNGPGQLFVNDGGGFTSVPFASVGSGNFVAAFPATDCGSPVDFYISFGASDGVTATLPFNAPTQTFSALSASDIVSVFADDFETNTGWAVSGTATDGQWNRGVPVNCGRGDPSADFDGSGQAYLTDNSSANSCNSDIDGGETILTSPAFDATVGDVVVSYATWYSNDFGADPNNDTMTVEISSNNGATWTTVEVIGPAGPQASGGWFEKEVRVADFVTPSSQTRMRFRASDNGSGSVVEAGVDAFNVKVVQCDTGACSPADLSSPGTPGSPDGTLTGADFFEFLNRFQAGDLSVDFSSPGNPGQGDGTLTGADFFEFLNLFGQGC